jgi:FkbM family methyltransferase
MTRVWKLGNISGFLKSGRNIRSRYSEYNAKTLTRDDVIWAYRILLERDPETEDMLLGKLAQYANVAELRRDILASPEFHMKNPDAFAYASERNIVITELSKGLRLFVDLSDCVIGLNIINKSYEVEETKFVKSYLRDGMTVLDIGANIGYFSIIMASIVGPSGRVYAFEPLDRNVELLARSIQENGFEDSVVLERAAVGRAAGSMDLLYEVQTSNSGGAYLFTADAKSLPSGHALQSVPVVTLDEYKFERPIEFIKIDIEGAEPLALLEGGGQLLKKDHPLILAEINPVALLRTSGYTPTDFVQGMQRLGYKCHRLQGMHLGEQLIDFEGEAMESVIFVPEG